MRFFDMSFLRMAGRILLILISFFAISCQTPGHRIENVDRAILDVRKVIESVIGESVEVSKNGRVFKSGAVNRTSSVKSMPSSEERIYDSVTILGDRRPYRILVQSMSQKRLSNGYSPLRYNAQRSRDIGLIIQMRLSQSRGDKNFIDDFRPF